jgi:hypothetical protein
MATGNGYWYNEDGGYGAILNPNDPSGLGVDTQSPLSPYYGLTGAPSYEAGYNPNSPENVARMNQFTMQMGGLNQTIGDLKGYANNRGDSQWAVLQKQKVSRDEKSAKDSAMAKAAAKAGAAESNLAQTGGLTSGARERLEAGGAKNALDMSQDVSRDADTNRLQVGINDQQNKIQTLNALPGMESGALSSWTAFDNAETNRRTTENDRRQQYNLKVQEMKNQLQANERQAQATENSGKK